jgi:hypothetical protein
VSAGRYLEGVVLALVCVGTLGVGAHRLRVRLAPAYDGLVAWVADGVMFVALLILVLEAVGVIGVLDRVGVVAGCVLAGGLAWSIGVRGSPEPGGDGGSVDGAAPRPAAGSEPAAPTDIRDQNPSPHRRLVTAVALAGTSVVAAVWFGWTIFAYRHGMETVDTVWYHMPFAARFVQLHNIRHLQYFDPGAITAFYPANSELIHAFGIVLFGTDLLSPVLNLGWAAAALVCAWAIGRPWGREPHCLLACLPVLATPGIVDTQPGGAYDDIVCLALLLAMIALVVNGQTHAPGRRLAFSASVLASAAGGLALGSKYTSIAPAIAFGLGTVLILGRGRRWRHAAIWAGGLTLLGGYWYLRDAIAVGNPLPSLSIHLGPLSLPAPRISPTYTVWQYLGSGPIWRHIFIPGLRQSLGLAWWALILGCIAGAVAAIVRRREPQLALIGGLVLLSGFLFLVTPQLLGLPGLPIFFNVNVRYAVVPLALGLILLALAPVFGRSSAALVWLAASSLALVFTVLDPGVWKSGFPVKPFAPAIHGASALAGAVLGGVILVAGELWLWRESQVRHKVRRVIKRGSVLWLSAAAGVTAAAVVLGGWLVSDSYARDRYRDSPLLPVVYAWARQIHDKRIGVVGTNLQYPLSGPSISNFVQVIGVGEPHGGFSVAPTCSQWRTAVNQGRYDYVLVVGNSFNPVGRTPALRWTQTSPAAHPIVRQYFGSVEYAVVFRITGPLAAADCRAS